MRVDRPHATPFPRLHHWGLAHLLVGNAPGLGRRAPRSTPWRLRPWSVPMEQGGTVCRPWIAGQTGDQVRRDRRDPLQPYIGCRGCALADDTGHDQAPLRGPRHPNPGLAIGGMRGLRPRERRVFRMDNAPSCVQRTRSEGQRWPSLQDDKPTRLGGAIEPDAHGIFLHLDDPRRGPDRMAFRSGANGQFTQRRVMLHIAIGCPLRPGDATPARATPGLVLAPCGPMRDPPALAQAHAVKRTDRLWTV